MTKRILFVMLLLPAVILFARMGGPDSLGHYFMDDSDGITFDWIDTSGCIDIDPTHSYDDDGFWTVVTPFPITFYGRSYSTVYPSTNGLCSFNIAGASDYSNDLIPSRNEPDNFVAVYWDDMQYDPVEGDSRILKKTIGDAPNRKFVITWHEFYFLSGGPESPGLNFQIIFYEGAGETKIKCQYLTTANGAPSNDHGTSATVGIELDGTDGLSYSFDTRGSLEPERAIQYTLGLYDYDVGVTGVTFEDTVWAGGELNPTVFIENIGDSTVTGVSANLRILDPMDAEIYNEDLTIGDMASDIIDTAAFPSLTLGMDDELGSYRYIASIASDFDENMGNDTLSNDFYLMAYDIMITDAVISEEIGLGIEEVFTGTYINRSLAEVTAHLTLMVVDSLDSVVHEETIDETAIVSDDEMDFEFSAWTPDIGGDYEIRISASAEGDQVPGNDTLTGMTMVLEHDVEVESMTAPSMAEVGDMLSVSAVIVNNGGSDEEVTVILSVDGTDIADTISITMSPGDVDSVEFDEREAEAEGDFMISVTAQIEADQIPGNNTQTSTVSVLAAHIDHGGPDSLGYQWFDIFYDESFTYRPISIDGAERLELFVDDGGIAYELPFSFPYYEEEFDSIGISTNGWISFTNMAPRTYSNTAIPNPSDVENGMLCVLWDDLDVDTGSDEGIYIKEVGTSEVHIIWWNINYLSDASSPITFECILTSGGVIIYNYETVRSSSSIAHDMGRDATIGIESPDGRMGLQYAYNGTPSGNPIFDNFAIQFCSFDSAGPAISVDIPDTLWLIPGTGGSTVLQANVVDYSSVVATELFVYIDDAWESFLPDSNDVFKYSFAPTGLTSGEVYDFYITAEDSLGNITGRPDDFLTFTAYEEHMFEGEETFEWDYKWADNFYTDSAVVEYEWIEIDPADGGEGIVITGVSDDWLSMPVMFEGIFSFPFYGSFGSFVRICSNGYISFDPLHSSPAVYPPETGLPDMSAPKYLIAPFWTDLFMGSTGKVIYWMDDDNDRAIFEWKGFELAEGATPGVVNTFQVILDFSLDFTRIIMNYQEIDPAFGIVAIGLQDGDGLEGLNTFTEQYPPAARLPQDGYSIMFYNRDETSVDELPSSTTPDEFEIVSAYPNPFNSKCQIDYTLPIDGNVNIQVFDVMGNLVESNQSEQQVGKHSFTLDASNMASGVYNVIINYDQKAISTRVLFVK